MKPISLGNAGPCLNERVKPQHQAHARRHGRPHPEDWGLILVNVTNTILKPLQELCGV